MFKTIAAIAFAIALGHALASLVPDAGSIGTTVDAHAAHVAAGR